METFEQPKITGYRQLSEDEAKLINKIKDTANAVGNMCDAMKLAGVDQRWLAIGTTQLQQGFMALVRSIARPESF